MIEHALYYLGQGLSVIPQMPGAKSPLVEWKRYQSIPPSRDLAVRWWKKWPDAGICLILGPVSGIVAVDVDSIDAERVLHSLLGGPPHTLTSRSGSRKPGKAHYFFGDPGFHTAAKYTPLHRQLELRGHGGYVVLPPSLHPAGKRYEWVEPLQEVAALPAALAAVWRDNPRFLPRIIGSPSRMDPVDHHPHFVRATPSTLLSVLREPGLAAGTQRWLLGQHAHQHKWNSRLFNASCDLAGLGIPLEVAEPLLLYGAQPYSAADDQQARQTIRSAFSQPRVPLQQYATTVGQSASPNSALAPMNDHDSVRIFAPTQLRRSLKVEG